jgi:hypothetical protein
MDSFAAESDSDADESQLLVFSEADDDGTMQGEHWTRVFSRDQPSSESLVLFPIGADILVDQALRKTLQQLTEPSGKILFSPNLVFKTSAAADL